MAQSAVFTEPGRPAMQLLSRTLNAGLHGGRGVWLRFGSAPTPPVPRTNLPQPPTAAGQRGTSRWLGMTEPVVAMTDYLLAFEVSLFAAHTARQPTNHLSLRSWLTVFFGSIAAASLAGGTVHGFFPEPESKGHRFLWIVTYVAIGVTALGTWVVGAKIACPPPIDRLVTGMATVAVAAYLIVVLFISREFIVAIAAYVPATSFLLGALLLRYRRTGDPAMLVPVAGVVLTFIAAGVQAGRLTVHPHLLDHNALYHLIQAAALALLFVGVESLLDSDRQTPPAVVVPRVAR